MTMIAIAVLTLWFVVEVTGLVAEVPSDILSHCSKDCCSLPPDLGLRTLYMQTEEFTKNIFNLSVISPGGWYKPKDCTAKQKVAVIVPYRDREEQLTIFLRNMHPFLIRQQLDYRIFVIEQQGTTDFNRGKLFNVGFVEANRARENGWDCFIFHDVDLLPLDERNLYMCQTQPLHLSASIDEYNFILPYPELCGGAIGLTYAQFTKVNGFPNNYWGWGSEDDDFSFRIRRYFRIFRNDKTIARYTTLKHPKRKENPYRWERIMNSHFTDTEDGLISLRYSLVSSTKYLLYTYFLVNITGGAVVLDTI